MEDNFTTAETTNLTTSEPAIPDNITLPKLEEEIKYHLNQISQNIIDVGKRLIQAKSLIKHGKWQQWLNDNFQLKQRSAQTFMACAEMASIHVQFPCEKLYFQRKLYELKRLNKSEKLCSV